jgi:hypothetical protein
MKPRKGDRKGRKERGEEEKRQTNETWREVRRHVLRRLFTWGLSFVQIVVPIY